MASAILNDHSIVLIYKLKGDVVMGTPDAV